MKKILLTVCFALALVLAALPAALATEGDFVIDTKGVLTQYNGSGGDVVIPDGVTGIGRGAFEDCTGLTSVTIPDSVTSIGASAFKGCTSLSHVVIPSTVSSMGGSTYYGESVFQDCSGLKTAGPIGDGYDIEFGWGWAIPSYAFYQCPGLTSVVVPEGVYQIGEYAFGGCPALSRLTVPASVMKGYNFIYDCPNLKTAGPIGGGYDLEFGWTDQYPDSIFRDSSLVSIVLPEGITTIESWAFCNCESLTSIVIPEGVTTIEDRAFQGCVSLSHIVIPGTVTTMGAPGWDVFEYCDGLPGIKTAGPIGGGYNYEFGWTKTFPQGAFSGCSNLTSVTISEGMTSIGQSQFASTSLTSVTIPDSVTSIGSYAFAWCADLSQVTLPNGLTSLEDGVFRNCSSLTSIAIPESVTEIKGSAFEECTNLTAITIPDSVTDMGWGPFSGCTALRDVTLSQNMTVIPSNAFANCTSLTQVTIPAGVTNVDGSAFSGCTSLTGFSVEPGNDFFVTWDGVLINKNYENELICFPRGRMGAYTIPYGVGRIGQDAFSGCAGLTAVTIPDSVREIGINAFSGCVNLTDVTISEGVGIINVEAFQDTPWLASQGEFVIVNDVLIHYQGPGGDVVIPEGVTSIGGGGFRGCDTLTSVVIPEGATRIEWQAFSSCQNLTRVIIPEGVTYIGEFAFNGCYNLSDVTIPGSATDVEGSAFSGTPWRENQGDFFIVNGVLLDYQGSGGAVTVPDGVTEIGDHAFSNCSSLTSVVIPGGVTRIGSYAFERCTHLCSVVIPDGVAVIGSWTFSGCECLTNVTIPDSVTKIGYYAFSNCSRLTGVTIPDGMTTIDSGVFQNCTSLTSATIPNGVTTINPEAFSGCYNLSDVTIPESVKNIYDQAFAGTPWLNKQGDFAVVNGILLRYRGPGGEVVVPEEITSIGCGAFQNRADLTAVTIPAGVTRIEQDAFSGCTGLREVVIPEGVTSIGYWAFRDCTGLTEVSVPASVKSFIGKDAFANTPWLSAQGDFAIANGILIRYQGPGGKVVIPSGVRVIGFAAFAGREDVTAVTIPDGVTMIRQEAFFGCTSLREMTIPASVTEFDGYHEFDLTPWLAAQGDFAIVNGYLIKYQGKGGNVTIPQEVRAVGGEAFYKCARLTGVTIPEGVTRLGMYAFGYCTGLTQVEVPGSVKWLDWGVFSECTGLREATLLGREFVYMSEDLFRDCRSLRVCGYSGTQLQTYCKNNGVPFVPMEAPGTAREGRLESENGESLAWAVTENGEVSVAGDLMSGETVLVACYDSKGRFTGVKTMDAGHTTTRIDPATPGLKLFWLDSASVPRSPSAIVWGG